MLYKLISKSMNEKFTRIDRVLNEFQIYHNDIIRNIVPYNMREIKISLTPCLNIYYHKGKILQFIIVKKLYDLRVDNTSYILKDDEGENNISFQEFVNNFLSFRKDFNSIGIIINIEIKSDTEISILRLNNRDVKFQVSGMNVYSSNNIMLNINEVEDICNFYTINNELLGSCHRKYIGSNEIVLYYALENGNELFDNFLALNLMSNTNKCYDSINLDDDTTYNYLTSNIKDNIVLIIDDKKICFSRSWLRRLIRNKNICYYTRPIDPINNEFDYIKIPAGDINIVISNDDFHSIIDSTDSQFFYIKNTNQSTSVLWSKAVLLGRLRSAGIGGKHGQIGSEEIIYKLINSIQSSQYLISNTSYQLIIESIKAGVNNFIIMDSNFNAGYDEQLGSNIIKYKNTSIVIPFIPQYISLLNKNTISGLLYNFIFNNNLIRNIMTYYNQYREDIINYINIFQLNRHRQLNPLYINYPLVITSKAIEEQDDYEEEQEDEEE